MIGHLGFVVESVPLGPIPTQIVSNEEFLPWPRTAEQSLVEKALIQVSGQASKRLA